MKWITYILLLLPVIGWAQPGADLNDRTLSTGYASYQDATFTEGAPFSITAGDTVLIPVNPDIVYDSQLPPGFDSLYRLVDTAIVGVYGYSILVTYEYTMKQKTANLTTFTNWVGIGGGVGALYEHNVELNKGLNAVKPNNKTTAMYTLDTWEANGGQWIGTATQDLELYDLRIIVYVIHKGFTSIKP